MKLTGKKIVVMGGGSGIGLAAAKTLASMGGDVTVTGRDQGKLDQAVRQAGVSLRAEAVDASSAEALRAFYAGFGPFDHLVLTLSGSKGAGFLRDTSVADIREGFEAKFFPQLLAAKAALPTLARDGSITFVSAGSARSWLPGTAGLAAINGAIEAMVGPLARELKPLRVNAVSPGVIETSWWDTFPPEQRRQMLAGFAGMSLVGRNGQPEEVGDAIAYLVTNGFVTGTVLEIDGGLRSA